MSNHNNYQDFLIVLGEELKNCANYAIEKKNNSMGTSEESYAIGYLHGFHRIITLIQQHAEIYDIELSELGLDDIKDTDLM